MKPTSQFLARHLSWGALALVPAVVFVWLRTHQASDPKTVAPDQHFYIVSLAALVCFALAVTGVRAALQMRAPRAYLVSIGFLLMAGFFSVHGLATPGFLLDRQYAVVVGFSARMTLVVGALFLALAAVPFSERAWARVAGARIPLFVAAGLIMLAYAVLAFLFPESMPPRIMKAKPFLNGTLAIVTVCSVFAAVAYARMYWKSGVAVEGALAVSAVLMLEAQFAMHYAALWQWSWWLYHLQLLAAFSTMLAYPFGVAATERARKLLTNSPPAARAA